MRPQRTPVLTTILALLFSSALLAAPVAAGAQAPPDALVGDWAGTLAISGAELRIVFHVERADGGGLTATLDSPDQGAYGISAGAVRVEGDSVTIPVAAIGGGFAGVLAAGGEEPELRGTWSQGGRSVPLVLTPASAEDAAPPERPQEPEEPLPYRAEDVTFRNDADGITLAGTFTRPEGEGPFPAVALVTGSGPQDRDETVAGHRPFLVLSDYLTRRGIAVLRYDDRGVGESGGAFEGATSEDFARDAAAAVRWLAGRDEVDTDRIGVLGHSEGGLVAPLVSRRTDAVDFLVLLAGPALTGEEILYVQGAAIARSGGAGEERLRQIRQRQERLFRVVLEEDDLAARKARLREILREEVAGDSAAAIPGTAEADSSDATVEAQVRQLADPWFRFFLRHDPAPVLEELDVPVLALFGGKDRQVPADTNRAVMRDALERAPTGSYEVRELEGLNHLFQEAETGHPSEYAGIEQTMAPRALEAVADWILRRGAGGG